MKITICILTELCLEIKILYLLPRHLRLDIHDLEVLIMKSNEVLL